MTYITEKQKTNQFSQNKEQSGKKKNMWQLEFYTTVNLPDSVKKWDKRNLTITGVISTIIDKKVIQKSAHYYLGLLFSIL